MLAFPLPLSGFFDLLPIAKTSMKLQDNLDFRQTGGGEVLATSMGAALWTGKIDLAIMEHHEAAQAAPLINRLSRAGSFLVADLTRPWPRLDPDGVMLTGSSPVIASVGSSMRELSLSGLPARYTLSRGDLLSFVYAGRHALHEVIEDAVASNTGATGLFEVHPAIRTGATAGMPVALVWPHCKARMLPKDATSGTAENTITNGASFSWMQTLRA
jgi:hypothetical protein